MMEIVIMIFEVLKRPGLECALLIIGSKTHSLLLCPRLETTYARLDKTVYTEGCLKQTPPQTMEHHI